MILSEFLWFITGAGYTIHTAITNRKATTKLEEYDAGVGYNLDRQFALGRLFSTNVDKFEELSGYEKRYGHHPRNYWEEQDAIKEIAAREGWTYFDSKAYINDPKRRKIMDKIK